MATHVVYFDPLFQCSRFLVLSKPQPNSETFETQTYMTMTSTIFTNPEVNMLHALRSRCTECKV